MLQEETLRPDSSGLSSHKCLVKMRLTLKLCFTFRKYIVIYPSLCICDI